MDSRSVLSTVARAGFSGERRRKSAVATALGIALLLTGIGFAVLVAGGAVQNPDSILRFMRSHRPHVGHKPTTQES
jgi:hypothetical protein